MIKLTLPHPVSANAYWATRAWIDKASKQPKFQTYVTPEAEKFKRDAGFIAKAAGFRQPTMNPVEIGAITLIPPATTTRYNPHSKKVERVKNGRRLDIDNCLKVVFDALKQIVYVDDKQIERICGPIGYGEPADPGALIIEIRELETAQSTLFGALAPARPELKPKRPKPLPGLPVLEPVSGKDPF